MKYFFLTTLLLLLFTLTTEAQQKPDKQLTGLVNSFKSEFDKGKLKDEFPKGTKIDSVYIEEKSGNLIIKFNKRSIFKPFREDKVGRIYTNVRQHFSKVSDKFPAIKVLCDTFEVTSLIPEYYKTGSYDKSKVKPANDYSAHVSVNLDKPYTVKNGLNGRNLVLWQSHGWYYSPNDKMWMWQRARLFQTVEDLSPTGFVIPFLAPMLENAGAGVFLARERDTQINEVIIDNGSNGYKETSDGWISSGAGFGPITQPLYGEENPFTFGDFRLLKSPEPGKTAAEWTFTVPETGDYFVSVAYGSDSSKTNSSEAVYSVYHSGGRTDFRVNQQIGYGTWIYLAQFRFNAGENYRVSLASGKSDGNYLSADAVRLGGGMGIVARDSLLSGRPKFVEGSKYYEQFMGAPADLVYNMRNFKDDYVDDYQSRSEYANWLNGAPAGPNRNRNYKGLGIPIDLSLAFHTDAGVRNGDTTLGTLAIYSVSAFDTTYYFPDGVSRLSNRDLADIVQTIICEDIEKIFDSRWSRRDLWDSRYAEAVRSNFPSLLLELLSQQDITDMAYASDPRFRFYVSRSIYKGIVKFLATYHGTPYVIQPLPVNNFSVRLEGNSAVLNWSPVHDPVEKTALPSGYVVYRSENLNGFDNGRYVTTTSFTDKDLKPGVVYSYKVTAVNDGGESFPSEVLAAGIANNAKGEVLIVNGFDRVSGPAKIETPDFAGFMDNIDMGVPWGNDISYTGSTYDFNPKSEFRTNDAPGFGASYGDYEGKVIAGNNFDYAPLHGKSVLNAGYSFSSASDESVENGSANLLKYKLADFIYGEEKTTGRPIASADGLIGEDFSIFTPGIIKSLKNYLDNGGKLFISGSYLGSETRVSEDTLAAQFRFGKEYLKITLQTKYASKSGKVNSFRGRLIPAGMSALFSQTLNDKIYAAEAPESFYPAEGAEVLMLYDDNWNNAVTGYKGKYSVVTMGFPFETITASDGRDLVMKHILDYLTK